jgi:hypothetical protein
MKLLARRTRGIFLHRSLSRATGLSPQNSRGKVLHSHPSHRSHRRKQADKSVPGVFENKVGYYFQPLFFHSFIGAPDHMAIRVDIHAPPSWGKESELKAFLANYLVKRFPGAKNTATILIGA